MFYVVFPEFSRVFTGFDREEIGVDNKQFWISGDSYT